MQHSAAEQTLLLPVEIYIFFLNLFFRKIGVKSSVPVIALSIVDAGLIPKLFYRLNERIKNSVY